MTAPSLTPRQAGAVHCGDRSFVVLAGAGSGKTRVLVERYLHLISPEGAALPISSIVAITFTERAAQEMKERIWRRMGEEAERGHGDAWKGLQRELHDCQISTMHSLCARLLRSCALDAAIDPSFTVLDDGRARSLRSRAIRDFLRRELDEGDADLSLLTEVFGSQCPELLRDALTRGPDGRAILRGRAHMALQEPDLVDRLEKALAERLEDPALERVLKILAENRATVSDDRLETRRILALRHGETARRRSDLTSRLAALSELEDACKGAGNCGRRGAWPDEESLTAVRGGLKALGSWCKERVGTEAFDLEGNRRVLKVEEAFCRVFERLADEWTQIKTGLACMDFDELLERTVSFLEGGGEGAEKVRASLRHVLVDEFQDTNDLQRRLIYGLAGHPEGAHGNGARLFVVGDPKQSIYRFRGADCAVFETVRQDILAGGGGELQLDDCFRMGKGLSSALNPLFSGLLGHPEATAHDPAHVPLQARRNPGGPDRAVELLLFASSDAEIFMSERVGEADAIRHLEAERLAGRLRDLVDQDGLLLRELDGKQRPATWGDMAILMRALTHVSILESAFQRAGIPFVTLSGRGFFDRSEIVDLLNVLRALAMPWDDVALAAVLRSPMVGLDDLALLRLSGLEGPNLWLRLQGVAERPTAAAASGCERVPGRAEGPSAFAPHEWERLRFAAALFRSLRPRFDRVPPEELVEEILDRSAYEAFVLSTWGGRQRQRNLRHLVDFVAEFCRQGLLGLHDFLAHVDELRSQGDRAGDARARVDRGQALRISTIHGAKGLEFPIVVVPDLHRREGASRRALQIRSDPLVGPDFSNGVGLRLPRPHRDDRSPRASQVWHALTEEARLRDGEEDKRLLYVAATRARDYLILSGAMDFENEEEGRWSDWIRRSFAVTPNWLVTPPPDEELPPGICLPPPPGERCYGASSSSWTDPMADGETRQRILEGVASLPPSFGRDEVSTTELMDFARCPRRFEWIRLRGMSDFPPPGEPGDGEDAKLDAGRRGDCLHRLMELWDFDEAMLPTLVDRVLHEAGLEGFDDFRQEACRLALAFSDSKLGRRLRRVTEERRECSFVLDLGSGTLVGIVDRLFRDESGWWVLDYKSNRVDSQGGPPLAERYRLQLQSYAVAASRLLGEPVRGQILYFFDLPEAPVIHDVTAEALRSWEEELAALLGELDACHRRLLEGSPRAFPPRDPCPKPCGFDGLCEKSRLAMKP